MDEEIVLKKIKLHFLKFIILFKYKFKKNKKGLLSKLKKMTSDCFGFTYNKITTTTEIAIIKMVKI